jgi:inner membrane protein
MTATTPVPSRVGSLLTRPGPRLAGLALLILLLLIPLAMIEQRVLERGERRNEAAAGVAQSWGQAQSLAGPMLRLPYTVRWREGKEERSRSGWLVLPPHRLEVDARLESQVRRRGIFEVPVYRARTTLRGEFVLPDLGGLGLSRSDVDFGRAELMIGIAEPGAMTPDSRASVADQDLVLEPAAQSLGAQGVHARLPQGVPADALLAGVPFELGLSINGSSAFSIAPVARETALRLSSDWPHPSFTGRGLPTHSRIGTSGFEARWSRSHLGRGYPPVWLDDQVGRELIDASAFGVELCVPVDPYRMAERITKYGALLLLLSFAAIWVMELLGGRPLHPVQYLLLGGSLCLFGLLQLALAEHLGFSIAFALAAGAVVIQAAWYTRVATGSLRRAFGLAGLLGGWFGYLYVVLQAEDLAFLLGALALFAALTAVMWSTRKVNWSTAPRWDVADATVE